MESFTVRLDDEDKENFEFIQKKFGIKKDVDVFRQSLKLATDYIKGKSLIEIEVPR